MALTFSNMKVGGISVPAEMQTKGFMAWSRSSPLPGYAALGCRLAEAMGMPEADLARAGDRLIQKLRKGGYIRLEKGKWFLTEKGENLRYHIENDA